MSMSETPGEVWTGYMPVVRWTRVVDLTRPVDEGRVMYQRNLYTQLKNGKFRRPPGMTARFRKYGEKFLPERWELPKVSRRNDGTLAVMDGNGRCHFAQDRMGDSFQVPYLEYENMTLTQEIAFYDAQRYRKQLTQSDFLQAQLLVDDSAARQAVKRARECGFEVGQAPGRGLISAGTLDKLTDSELLPLEETLSTLARIRDAYPGDHKVTSYSYALAVAKFISNDRRDRSRMDQTLLASAPLAMYSLGSRDAIIAELRRRYEALK